MANITWIDPGSSATYDLSFPTATANSAGGSISSDGTNTHDQPRAYKFLTGGSGGTATIRMDSILADAGSLVSLYVRWDTSLPTNALDFMAFMAPTTTIQCKLRLNTSAHLEIVDRSNNIRATGTATIVADTWYRISIGFLITSTTVNTLKVYVNAVNDINASNITISGTGVANLQLGFIVNPGNSKTMRMCCIFADARTDSSDCGDVRCTAKLPASDNVNNFDTAVGASPAADSRYTNVNERALSITNGFEQAGTSLVEESFGIQAASVGDVDISLHALIGRMAWIYSKGGGNATATLVHNGSTVNVSITSSATLFTDVATSTTYPANAAAIGMKSTNTATDTYLYECGIVFAYNSLFVLSVSGAFTPSGTNKNQTQKPLSGALSSTRIMGTLANQTKKTLTGTLTSAGILVKSILKPLTGGWTPTGTLTKKITFGAPFPGSIGPSGTLSKRDSKTLTGSITPAGGYGPTTLVRTILGGITPTKVLAKLVSFAVPFSGALTPAGVLTNQTQKPLGGSLAPSAVLFKLAQLSPSGTLTSAGTLVRQTQKPLGGVLFPVGVLVRRTAMTLLGFITPAGALTNRVQKTLTAVLSPAGALYKLVSFGTAFAGSITPAGTLTKQAQLPRGGTIGPAGTLVRATRTTFGAVVGPSGTLTKTTSLGAFLASLASAGSLIKQPQKPLSGQITPGGTLVRLVGLHLVGALAPAGALYKRIMHTFSMAYITVAGRLTRQPQKPVGGGLASTGMLVRQVQKPLSGQVTPLGDATRQTRKALAGALAPAGSVLRTTQRAFSGVLGPVGLVRRTTQMNIGGTLIPTGQLNRLVGHIFVGAIRPAGTTIRSTNLVLRGTIQPVGVVGKFLRKTFVRTLSPAGALYKLTTHSMSGSVAFSATLKISRLFIKVMGGTLAFNGTTQTLRMQAGKVLGTLMRFFVHGPTTVQSLNKSATSVRSYTKKTKVE